LNLELVDIVAAGVILTLASMLQSVVGFGYALFATPLLVWIGLPLPSVITLVATCSMLQALTGVRNLRAAVPWRLSVIATGIRLAGLLFGLFLLKRLVVLEKDQIRAVIGVILCVLVVVQLLWQPHPVRKLPRTATSTPRFARRRCVLPAVAEPERPGGRHPLWRRRVLDSTAN